MSSFRRRRWLLANRLAHGVWRRLQQSGTITADTQAGQRFAAFGPGSLIAFPTGSIYGERWIEVGDGTMIGEQASVCAGMMPGHDLGPETVLRIGDRCIIGRGSHIVAHCSIDIGDDVYTGPYVYITDQNHSYADPDVPIGRQWPVNSAVRIGAGTWLGTGVIILPGSVIGRNVVVAAGSVVRGEIGDYCVVAGVPAKVVKDYRPEAGWTRAEARPDGETPAAGETTAVGESVVAGESVPASGSTQAGGSVITVLSADGAVTPGEGLAAGESVAAGTDGAELASEIVPAGQPVESLPGLALTELGLPDPDLPAPDGSPALP